MAFDYSRLRGKIRERYSAESAFAAALGIGRASLSRKLNNESDFTCRQMQKAAQLLEIPRNQIAAYFFAEEVRKREPECEWF